MWLVGVRADARQSSVYAMTSRGLFESHTRGRSWRRLGAGGQFLGFDATRPGHLLGTGQRSRVGVSFDAGNTWRAARMPRCVPILDGVVFSRAGDALYGWSIGGITSEDADQAATVVSRDGGRSFAKVLPYDAEAVAVTNDPRLVYATADGLIVSRTAGADWQRAGAPLDSTHAIAAAPATPRAVFVAADTGRFVESREGEGGTTQRLYRSLDAGKHWTNVLEMFDITSINVAPSHPAIVYVAGEQITNSRAKVVVLRSRDVGRHWQTRSSEPSSGGQTVADLDRTISPNTDTLAVDPVNPNVLYRDIGTRVQRSLDGGRSFTTLRNPPHG